MASVRQSEKNAVRYLIGALLSVLLLILAFNGVEWKRLVHSLTSVDLAYASLATAFLLASLLVRALRWQVLLGALGSSNLHAAFSYMMIGYLINNVLPFRLGEVARAALLGEKLAVSKTGVLATVVVERLLDVLSLLIFVALLLFALDLPAVVTTSILVAEIVAVVGFGWLIWLAWRGHDAGRYLPRFVPEALRARLLDLLHGFVGGLQVLKSGRQTLAAITWSILSWTLFALGVTLFLRASGLSGLPWYAPLLVIVVTNLGSAIPTSPGFVGGYHFLAVFALSLWSVPKDQALSFAILVHGVNYVLVSGIGAIALWRENIAFGELRRRVQMGGPSFGQEQEH